MMQFLVIEQIIKYFLAMLQPNFGVDESLDIDFGIQSGCSDGARVKFDVGLNEESAEIAPSTTIK